MTNNTTTSDDRLHFLSFSCYNFFHIKTGLSRKHTLRESFFITLIKSTLTSYSCYLVIVLMIINNHNMTPV